MNTSPAPSPPTAPPAWGFTRAEFAHLLLLPFRGPGSLVRWLFGCAAILVPILGWYALMGYEVRVARAALEGEPERLPGWSGPKDLAIDAFRLVAIFLVLSIPVVVLAIVLPSAQPVFGAALWVLLPGALQAVAADRSGEAFAISHYRRLAVHWRIYVPLLLIIGGVAFFLWAVGLLLSPDYANAPFLAIPIVFWGATVQAAAAGRAAFRMGLRAGSPIEGVLELSRQRVTGGPGAGR